MCLSQYRWAEFRKTKAGVKMHLRLVFMDRQVIPDKVILTHARHADRTKKPGQIITSTGWSLRQRMENRFTSGTSFAGTSSPF